jgi:HEAT repeat protein
MSLSSTALIVLLVAVAVGSVVLSVLLFFIKLAHRLRNRAEGVRRAHYIGAIGELAARHTIPTGGIDGWPDDPVFLEVLFDFLTIVTGEERETLEDLVVKLELRDKLERDLRRAGTVGRKARALSYLVEIADPSLQHVFSESLADPVTELQLHGARGLAAVGDPASVGEILEAMEHVESWVAARLADELVEFGSPAVPSLVTYLVVSEHDPQRDPELLRQVTRATGLIGDLRAEPALITMLSSAEPIIRVGAASALSKAGSPAAVPTLIGVLDDPDARVRARAADALGMFSDPRAIEPLGAVLSDEDWWVRQDAAKALVTHLGGKARLVRALGERDPYARDAALSQLGKNGSVQEAADRAADGIASTDDLIILKAADLVRPVRLHGVAT